MRLIRLLSAIGLVGAPLLGAFLPGSSASAAGLTFSTATVEFYFGGDDGLGYECQVDSGPVSGCSSPARFGPLDNGSHVFRVRPVATDGTEFEFQVINFTVAVPVIKPSASPSVSPKPTVEPIATPAATQSPTAEPTNQPTREPTQPASGSNTQPSDIPISSATVDPTPAGSQPQASESAEPSAVAMEPASTPTDALSLIEAAAGPVGTPYDPAGSPQARAATVQSVTTGVVVAATMAAAAAAASAGASAAAGSARAGSAGSSSSSSSSSDSTAPDFEQLDVSQDSLTLSHQGSGDLLAFAGSRWFGWLDRRSHNAVESVAPFSPLLAKVMNDGSYLRAMAGIFSVIPMVAAASFGAIPGWVSLLWIAVLGIFDATAGLIGGIALTLLAGAWIAALNPAGSLGILPSARLIAAVLLICVAPGIVATTFRSIRRSHAHGFDLLWERLIDLALAPFMAGWTVANLVGGLSAIAGVNLEIAKHSPFFGIAIAVAMAIRVALEEAAARWFPARLNAINPDEIIDPSLVQRSVSLTLKFCVWMLLAAALMGASWQVWVGTALTILPSIAGWFSDRFPNYPWIWRILPQGLPALFVSLVIGALSASLVKALVGDVPSLAAWSSLLVPLPLVALGIAGMFGRNGVLQGNGEEEARASQKNPWVYRIGGVVLFVAVLRLTGLI